jgi:hypothetical protein
MRVSHRKSTTPNRPERLDAPSKQRRTPSLVDIEETQTSLWVAEQLNRIHAFLVEHSADTEMLDAVEYLREDNERWIDPNIAEDLRSGKLHSGEA